MLTTEDKQEVRIIVKEETADMRQDIGLLKVDVRRNSVLLEDIDHKIAVIAENVSAAMQNSMRINDIDKRLVVVEHLNGISA
jgi:hypothetical protein